MRSIYSNLFAIFLGTAAFSYGAKAERLFNAWPTCDTPSAVGEATRGYWRLNSKEFERLGCVRSTPQMLHVRVIRCAPSALDHEPAWFSYPVARDSTLPEGICEIEAHLPDGWNANLYTYFMNIWWSD